MIEEFEALKELRKEAHLKWFYQNMEVIKSTDLEYEFKETVVLIRDKRYPKVDFYPHTGRWKYKGHICSGGVNKMLKWIGYNDNNK